MEINLCLHCGISDDSVKALSIFIFVIECYSESEQEDPEIAAETPPPPHASQTQSSVCTDISSLLVIDQMRGCHFFQLGRK